MKTPPTERTKVSGNLDIPRLFQAEALSLLEAVERGKLLHATKNIRDSGGPLEACLRKLLADRMPSSVQVGHGHLYDVNSKCTPQIDAMVLSALDNHTMMSTEEGAIYAPFASALAIIEIKSSVDNVASQLEQTDKIVRDITGMANDLRSRRPGGTGASLPAAVSVLFYATSNGAKINDFRKWQASGKGKMPTYVVFLDRACNRTRHVEHIPKCRGPTSNRIQ